MSGSGTLGFLVSGSYGPASGTGTITYTDGSTQSYTLNAPDWFSTSPPSGGAVAVSSAYQNRQGNTTYAGTGDIFSETVALTAGKTIASVTLPPGGALTAGPPTLHVFAVAASATSGEGPYGGTAAAVPGTVQAANYDTGGQGVAYNVTSVNGTGNGYRSDGVDLETCTDTSCGYDLGWTATAQWFKYTVNAATAGTYTVSLRLASPNGVTDGLHIANSAGANLSGPVNVPDTGGWQTWATATASVTLPAGRQTLTVDQDNGGWNLHSLAFAAAGGGSTTNLALNRPVTGSSVFQNYVPSNAVDGNTGTYWESTDGAGYPQTITVNLGSAQTIESITLDLPPLSNWNTRTETLSVLGSTNGTTFSQIVGSAGYTFNPATGNTVTISLPSGTSAQYVELSFTANTGWDAAQLSELQIYG
jgi:hypothetical protein